MVPFSIGGRGERHKPVGVTRRARSTGGDRPGGNEWAGTDGRPRAIIISTGRIVDYPPPITALASKAHFFGNATSCPCGSRY